MQATPKRVPAQLSLALEDIAAVGMADFEMALREALQARLSDSLDAQIISGSGNNAPNLNGLINQLANPAAPAMAVETFDRWASNRRERGRWALGVPARRSRDGLERRGVSASVGRLPRRGRADFGRRPI